MAGPRLARLGLALVAPLAVVLPAWHVWTAPEPWAPNAEVAAFDSIARAGPADLVVVGPSFARTDLDQALLGRELARPPLKAIRFAQNLASAPMWYAILKERVYGNGLKPQVVVLVATPDYLLQVRPPPSQMAGLEEHFAEPDDVLRAHTWDTHLPAPLQRALDHRGKLRDPVVAWFRDGPVNLLFGDGTGNGGELARAAGEAVFGTDHAAAASTRMLPVAETEVGGPGGDSGRVSDPMRSFLPDIAALVAAHGGRLVVLLPPVASSVAAAHAVSPAEEHAVVAALNRLGVGLIDLRDLPLTEFDYIDGYHMRPATRTDFTHEVAARMLAAGVMESGPMTAAWVPPSSSVSREGTPPSLVVGPESPGALPCLGELTLGGLTGLGDDELRLVAGHLGAPLRVSVGGRPLDHASRSPQGCTGAWFLAHDRLRVARPEGVAGAIEVAWAEELPAYDADHEAAYWVLPGTTTTFSYGDDVPPGALTLEASLVQPTGRGTSTLEIGGLVTTFSAEPRPSARVELPAAPAPLVIRVRSDVAVAIHTLQLRVGERTIEAVRPASVRLVDLFPGSVTAPSPPPLPVRVLQRHKGRVAFAAPWPDEIACSPLRVEENGVELPSGASAAGLTRRPKAGRVDHVGEIVYVASSDGTDPLTNGRSYTLTLGADRACRQEGRRSQLSRVWLYPGDTVESALAAGALGHDGPLREIGLQLAWNVDPPAGARVRFEVWAGEELRLSTTASAQELAELRTFSLSTPITRRDREPVRVRVTTEGLDTPVLLSAVGKEG